MIPLAALTFMAVLFVLGPGPGRVARFLNSSSQHPRGRDPKGNAPGFPRRLVVFAGREDPAAQLEEMAGVVHHLAALLASGRPASQAWTELHRFHGERKREERPSPAHEVSSGILASTARAAGLGDSPAGAILRELGPRRPGPRGTAVTVRCWERVALCVRASELSGCPLGALLVRLALDLEHAADAEGDRQTALAGPKASVALLSWLPFLGMGLGLLLGVDPVAVILGSPLGMLSVVAGLVLWAVGRMWSRGLVAAAEGGP